MNLLMNNITFRDLGVNETLIKNITKKGYIKPTEIQKKLIPILLNSNKNIIAQAQTGTGKTAAFGIPIIQNIIHQNNHIQAIILTPTRELAIQVYEELKTFNGLEELVIQCFFGGQSINIQIKQLLKNPDIIVGTPGRIIDLMKRKKITLEHISYFILDEADEMLNMGFIGDIEDILKETSIKKRMLFLSATMPKSIIRIAKKYMIDYDYISVSEYKENIKLINQYSIKIPSNLKLEGLCRLIESSINFYGLIFCGRKETANSVSSKLISLGYKCSVIHGDIIQEQRIKIMNSFKKKEINILIATDVAARGLDINDLSYVINYDIPQDIESYIHRIGRTGRAGKKGIAITLYTNSEQSKLNKIKKITGSIIEKINILSSNDITLIKQNKLISHIKNILFNIENDKYISIYRNFLDNILNQCNTTVDKLILCILKDCYENKIIEQEKDLKFDELMNNNKKINIQNIKKKNNHKIKTHINKLKK